MNHHHPPPGPTIGHRSSLQILRQTNAIFTSHLVTFLFLTALIFAFRSNVENASHYVTSFIDRDASLKSLLSRLDLSNSAGGAAVPHNHNNHLRRRRRPFLHLSRVGTLDDDFFSGDDSDFDRSLFHPSHKKPLPNASFVILSDFNPNYETVRPGSITFKPEILNNGSAKKIMERNLDDANAVVDLHFLVKGLELGRHDATSLMVLVGILSVAYGYIVLAFIVSYTWLHGIVFLQVVDHLVGNYRSVLRTVWDGSNIGLRRPPGFILMKWAVRDALAQILGIYFFGEIEDQYEFIKVFLMMKLMPFANVLPWVKEHEWESAGYICIWLLSDFLLGFIFAVDSWVAIVDRRRTGREIVKEGCHMLAALLMPALKIRWLEAVACGPIGRWILRRISSDIFALVFQSVMEVYFLVAWLVFYFAARHKDDASLGRTFGQRELDGLLEDVVR